MGNGKRTKAYASTRARKNAWQSVFLEHLAKTANVTASAELAAHSRTDAYDARNADPAFSAAWDAAIEKSVDALEQEARRRAHDGLIRKKFDRNGDPIIDPETGQQYIEREYSDNLMIQLLKAHRPKKYADRQHLALEGDLDLHIERLIPFSSGDPDANDPA